MNKKTYYHIILDQSGSMNDCLKSTVGGYNRQAEIIRSLPAEFPEQEFFVSLTKFSGEPEHVFFDVPAMGLTNLSSYTPQGNTALLDAVGECLFRLKADKQKEFSENHATAAVVIITDGFENASRYFTLSIISRLIADLTQTGNFTLNFLGATIESMQQAAQMNIRTERAYRFDKKDIHTVFENMGDSLKDYASVKRSGAKPDGLYIDNPVSFPGKG